MFNSTSDLAQVPHTYFKNSVGCLLAHPAGHYITVEYYPGPRQFSDLQAFLLHAGQLLARWGWDKLLGQQGQMAPLTSEEVEWLTRFWHSKTQANSDILYGALLLPHDAFARLSWRAKTLEVASPFRQKLT